MDYKKLLPLIMAIVCVIIFAVFVFKAMEPGDHTPSGVIEDINDHEDMNTDYIDDLFGEINDEEQKDFVNLCNDYTCSLA